MMHPRSSVTIRSDGGFTLIEVTVALAIATVLALAVALGVQSSAAASTEARELVLVQSQANQLLGMITTQPMGTPGDPDPTTGELDEIFDLDADSGPITVQQLTRWPAGSDGWEFSTPNSTVAGTWRVKVDRDLDGDGAVHSTAPLSPGTPPASAQEVIERLEYSGEVFRVRVFFDGRLVLAANRGEDES